MTDTDIVILDYLVSCRDVIIEGQALLERVRDGARPASSARKVFDGVLPEIRRTRSFASEPLYAGCRESLKGLAGDLEALRAEARKLL